MRASPAACPQLLIYRQIANLGIGEWAFNVLHERHHPMEDG